MIYDVRPSILWGGGTIASFIGTTTHTHKTILSPTERERFGLKNPARYSCVSQKSWNEWIQNDSELHKGGVFTGKQGSERPQLLEPASNAETGCDALRDTGHPRNPVKCFLTRVTSAFQPTTHTENDGLEGKGKTEPHTLPEHQEVGVVSMGTMCTSQEVKSKQLSFVRVSPVLQRTECTCTCKFWNTYCVIHTWIKCSYSGICIV